MGQHDLLHCRRPRVFQMYDAAADVHAERLQLESIGHPDFCGGAEEKSVPGADAAALRARAAELKAAANSWDRDIGAAKAANRRLHLLDGPALLRFAQLCADCRLADVLPYVLLCFPEMTMERAALADAVKAALEVPASVASTSLLLGPSFMHRAAALIRAVGERLGGGLSPILDIADEERENASASEADEAELRADGSGGVSESKSAEGCTAAGARLAESEVQVCRGAGRSGLLVE